MNTMKKAAPMMKRRLDWTPIFLIGSMAVMWALLHLWLGGSIYGSSAYNTYTLQAMAWRNGSLHLPYDYPWLELAIFEGNYYVSFPPLPSVILFPLTFLFGYDTPDNLLVKLYALVACIAIYCTLYKLGYKRLSAALFAFFFCFASSMLPMTMEGAVWYHAQVLAFLLMVLSFCFFTLDKPVLFLLCYAFSVCCRPFHAIYALPLFFTYFSLNQKAGLPLSHSIRSVRFGVLAGLCVAAALAVYNFLRFGNPLEFGHNYLPEFSFQGGVQFSVSHVLNHLKTFVWGSPVEMGVNGLQVKQFGYSFLLSCPMLLLMLIWAIVDGIKKRMSREKAVILFTFFVHLFLLLLHRTFGGYQLGARYTVDLIPYAFLYLLLSPKKRKMHLAEGAVLLLIFGFTIWGMGQVHI